MYFCDDIDLLPWEPAIFLQTAFAHQTLIKQASATLTGTALVASDAVLGVLLPGMVLNVATADDSLSQLLEVVSVADTTHSVLSALRGRNGEAAIPPLTGGSVKITLVTFRPQIAAVGDQLLALLGISSDRATDPAPESTGLAGFRLAAVFGTLAAVYRTLADTADATSLTLAKKTFYDNLFGAARRAISGTVDADADGTPETLRRADAPLLQRV
jgi:hypothetical protein